ncbi:mitogen-activated protein kinase 15 [Venturia canescens]|uniref:mitogen-activated protein kinase 15 n=1 Tax=Venturia canescens TaxID=32260 RepID=UPI001C9D3410|nr:mitogen-activated protein kinase 15-like [Venturia canescens]
MSGKSGKEKEKVTEIDNHVTEKYNIVRRLGKGAYGIVWKAVDRRSKETVAVKKIFDAFRNQTDAQRTFREIMFLLSFANHENIIQLIGLHKANNNQDIYLVFEYMDTDLHNVIKRGNILKDIHKVFIMYQLFKATKYIHSGNVIHRDLKPSNILLNTQCHCKIADFGLARSVTQIGEGDADSGSDPTLTDYVATRWYRAPEILIASKRYTKGIDMWSLGCILGEMLLEKPLFPGSSTINQVERIMATLPPPTPEDVASIGAGYGLNLLEKRPSVPRRTLRELLPPNIPHSALNLINTLIVFNPNNRLTAVQALEHPYVADFHSRANEPERGASVVPPLRDDVQLSIEEYRNKLYAMMDEKHRKHKNMSKSRIRRLSEHIRKETCQSVGQGDIGVKKNFYPSSDDVRRDPSKEDQATTKHQGSLNPPAHHHYNQSLMNGSFRNIPPGQAKSCLYLSQQQQQQLSKSQRSIQSDQVNAYGPLGRSQIPLCQPKLRRGVKSQPLNRYSSTKPALLAPVDGSTTNNNNSLSKLTLPKRSSPESPGIQAKYITRMPNNNVTKHFVTTIGTEDQQKQRQSCSNINRQNSQNRMISSQSRVIQNYLNQTLPMSGLQTREKRIPTKSRLSDRMNIVETMGKFDYAHGNKQPNNVLDNHRPKTSVIRNQTLKPHLRHSSIQKPVVAVRGARSLNNYTQNHAVITASAYKELRNSTMKW